MNVTGQVRFPRGSAVHGYLHRPIRVHRIAVSRVDDDFGSESRGSLYIDRVTQQTVSRKHPSRLSLV